MDYNLTFELLHEYDSMSDGIMVPVELSLGVRSVALAAKLDTGAPCCIFQRDYGRMLGLYIEGGVRESFQMANRSPFVAYGHRVLLGAIGLEFNEQVFFAEDPHFARNVLGREGWIRRMQLALVDEEGK